MTRASQLATKLFITTAAFAHATERLSTPIGTRFFLPALFVDRFSNMGAIDKLEFTRQLDRCRSFTDEAWSGHWNELAEPHIATADAALERLGGPSVRELLDDTNDTAIEHLGKLLAPAVSILSERGGQPNPDLVERFIAEHPAHADAATAVDALIKTTVYTFAASWPGWTPHRLQAYAVSRRLTHVLLLALAPAMDLVIEAVEIPAGNETVRGYTLFPPGTHRVPTLLATNGIEGTIAELLFPSLAHRPAGLGVFAMEMPGTYDYTQPMSLTSEAIYHHVIEYLAEHPRVDPSSIGMFGLSFGAYWSTRMAATDPRLRAVVSNGAPAEKTWALTGSIGVPEIMAWTLANTVAATGTFDLLRRLSTLTVRELCPQISIPLLVINGDSDTLVRSQDSIDIATLTPRGLLELYPGDDHCAMSHFDEWLDMSMRWVHTQLTT
ncbi:alpha/beta hydrolase family protein [Nocardia vinacea]|uniref:alpha/beta hydrolase family protein n=1 Tax=Nocardia vinacea TaxID=96468 RepID=UPI0005925153|nr:alpha/beta hydrolase [Nocardia vinacea]